MSMTEWTDAELDLRILIAKQAMALADAGALLNEIALSRSKFADEAMAALSRMVPIAIEVSELALADMAGEVTGQAN